MRRCRTTHFQPVLVSMPSTTLERHQPRLQNSHVARPRRLSVNRKFVMDTQLIEPSVIQAPAPINLATLLPTSGMVDFYDQPVRIQLNHFEHKSLSDWACNIAVGCNHGCRFCYVPAVSAKFLAPKLKEKYGIDDPDAQWGDYVLLRPLDEELLLADIRSAEKRPASKLSADGNRSIMLCTTTDAYQTITVPDVGLQRRLNEERSRMVRRIIELIRDNSTLNIRILTRSPLVRLDFDLFATLGNRLLFGMSLPTLNDRLARILEPNAPSPTQRLATLRLARDRGLKVFVAVAPTYAECDEADVRATLTAVKPLNPFTVYHEPINVRAENIARIAEHAKAEGKELNTAVFANANSWRVYAMDSLRMVQRLAGEVGLLDRLHLWPDSGLESESAFQAIRKADWVQRHGDVKLTKEQKAELKRLNDAAYVEHTAWLQGWWSRISEWPGLARAAYTPPQLSAASPFTAPTLAELTAQV